MVKGVILDMDGTMFATEQFHTLGWRIAEKELGIIIPDDIVEGCRGKNPKAMKKLFQAHFGEDFDFETCNKIREEVALAEAKKHFPVKAGLFELLGFLKEENIPAAVATSSIRSHAYYMLEKSGALDYMTAVVTCEVVPNGKPAPDIFLKAAEEIGVEPESCLVVEDTENGVKAALAAGGYVIHVPDIAIVPEELKAKTNAVLESLDKIVDFIKEENKL